MDSVPESPPPIPESVEAYWKHSEQRNSPRPRLTRRSSSMMDLMKYSMALSTEAPYPVFRNLDDSSLSSAPSGQCTCSSNSRKRRTESEPAEQFRSRVSTWSNSDFMEHSQDHVDGLLSRPAVLPYTPVKSHWFFCRKENHKDGWVPFTMYDSGRLEEAHHKHKRGEGDVEMVPTQGGRYDVSLKEKRLFAVYWDEEAYPVRRGTWFWKAAGEAWVPYEEPVAEKLEGEYKLICRTGEWQKRIDLPGGETIVLHSETTMIHYDSTKTWADMAETLYKNQKIVKRGWEGICVPDEGEWEPIDHLVFVSHGIGSYCDLKWRTLNQCVDAYRLMARNLIAEHFNFAGKKGKSFRVEFIPINWHGILHSDNAELENRIKRITLPSIPIVRYFANDYVLDILFYASPMYCRLIADHVGDDMNRLYNLFLDRNPGYKGSVSIVGHSLGSIVLFDMLSHQPDPNPPSRQKENPMDTDFSTVQREITLTESLVGDMEPRTSRPLVERHESRVSAPYTVPAFSGAGYPSVQYPRLQFHPSCFFAIGSPVGMFLAVRGVTKIGEDYCLPTCPRFLNIFHPNDPVAYRIEPLIIPEACQVTPSVIEHHKGRKRMHLEVQKNIATAASTIKSSLLDPFKLLSNLATSASNFIGKRRAESRDREQEGVNVTSPSEERLERPKNTLGPAAPVPSRRSVNGEAPKITKFGSLNGGNRVDYVLQEAPLESLNQYLFALNSHAVYWDSEDTLLLMLRTMIDIEKDNLTLSPESSEEEEHQYI
ncbi:SEC23-interacting protein-like isoform X2 [Paramacrobiotus metropolitanus]|nr:SEC23-interacting protein-like isoform X2 [Paramacrobiotus metropolitanus]XP_055331614.1 SEC23-interacting protein-like isoform X2 [Paramacrobiotus metropolitanus]XP_055331615.1 SEC23-interacting protein-like isoform X2 [Paramacrobiotus metropolitanus]XP_055331616.1 SEC23-interacting protein-like isoform X2 [Paramacrobiotus metropolitanus]